LLIIPYAEYFLLRAASFNVVSTQRNTVHRRKTFPSVGADGMRAASMANLPREWDARGRLMKRRIVWMLALGAALALGLTAAGSALAASKAKKPKVPDTVGPFLTFCDDHLKDCRGEIAIDEAVISLSNQGSEPLCLVPRGVVDRSADDQILGWLEQHDELAASSTSDGVTAAIKGIWNCAAEIPNGKTASGAPENTAAFLTYCGDQTHFGKCEDVITITSLRAYAASVGIDNGSKGHCSIPDKVKGRDATTQVLAWLQQHSETQSQDIEDTTVTAIDTLWPCH
jgi:hypothetical protein